MMIWESRKTTGFSGPAIVQVSILKDKIILDVSGNIGHDSQKFLNQGAILYTFEPVSENIDYLEKNIKAEPGRWILHTFGLAASDREMKIAPSDHKNKATSSFI